MVEGAVALVEALAGRVGALNGLREASGVLGPEYEAKQVIDRSFTVFLGEEQDTGGRVRTDGTMLVTRAVEIRLAHKLNGARGKRAHEQAYADAEAVKRALLGHKEDAYMTSEGHTALLGDAEPEISGGGTFLLSKVRFRTRYRFSIEPA